MSRSSVCFPSDYRALTGNQRQDDTLLLLNNQSGLVLGDSTVFSWVGCQRECLCRRRDRPDHRDAPPEHGWCRQRSHSKPRLTPDLDPVGAVGGGEEQGRVATESRWGGVDGDLQRRSTTWPPEIQGPRHGKEREVAAGRSVVGKRGPAGEWTLGFRASGCGLGG
jgi:hypothetical protein